MFRMFAVLAAIFALCLMAMPNPADAAQRRADGTIVLKQKDLMAQRPNTWHKTPRYYYYYNYVPGADGRYHYRPTYPYDFDYYSPYYYPPGNLWLRQHVPSTRYF